MSAEICPLRSATRQRPAALVVWGGIRDLEQIQGIDGIQIYYRGVDPTPIRDFVMNGFNTPVMIGGAVCLPGDVVFGYGGGVIFIPSHMVKTVITAGAQITCKRYVRF